MSGLERSESLFTPAGGDLLLHSLFEIVRREFLQPRGKIHSRPQAIGCPGNSHSHFGIHRFQEVCAMSGRVHASALQLLGAVSVTHVLSSATELGALLRETLSERWLPFELVTQLQVIRHFVGM